MKFIPLFVILLLLVACKPTRPHNILSEDDMEEILYDYHIALAMAELEKGDLSENRFLLAQAALRKHDITEAEFDSSLIYWCRHSEKMVKICERVTQRLTYIAETQGVERKEQNKYSYLKTEGDTANVWNLRKNVVLIPNVIDNVYSFTIDSDTTYMPGDYFEWVFTTQFLSSDHYNEAWALLSYHFDNDSIEGVTQRITSNKLVSIKLNCPKKFKDVKIRSINGTIFMPIRRNGFGILAVNDFIMVRYHDLTLKKLNDAKSSPMVQDTIVVQEETDSMSTRQNPYDIRDNQSYEKKIRIVKDKPVKAIPRRR